MSRDQGKKDPLSSCKDQPSFSHIPFFPLRGRWVGLICDAFFAQTKAESVVSYLLGRGTERGEMLREKGYHPHFFPLCGEISNSWPTKVLTAIKARGRKFLSPYFFSLFFCSCAALSWPVSSVWFLLHRIFHFFSHRQRGPFSLSLSFILSPCSYFREMKNKMRMEKGYRAAENPRKMCLIPPWTSIERCSNQRSRGRCMSISFYWPTELRINLIIPNAGNGLHAFHNYVRLYLSYTWAHKLVGVNGI